MRRNGAESSLKETQSTHYVILLYIILHYYHDHWTAGGYCTLTAGASAEIDVNGRGRSSGQVSLME